MTACLGSDAEPASILDAVPKRVPQGGAISIILQSRDAEGVFVSDGLMITIFAQ